MFQQIEGTIRANCEKERNIEDKNLQSISVVQQYVRGQSATCKSTSVFKTSAPTLWYKFKIVHPGHSKVILTSCSFSTSLAQALCSRFIASTGELMLRGLVGRLSGCGAEAGSVACVFRGGRVAVEVSNPVCVRDGVRLRGGKVVTSSRGCSKTYSSSF